MPEMHFDMHINGLSYDSRNIEEGWAFFAFLPISGGKAGDEFIEDALKRGASVIICRASDSSKALQSRYPDALFITNDNPQAEYSRWCSILHDQPQKDLQIIGVSGTDGKTSTCDFLYQILCTEGLHPGLLSTVSMDDGSGKRPSPYRQSTPEAEHIFQFLSDCKSNGLKTVIMEATSHSLSHVTSRLSQITFSGAIYTTISSEHLEFHHTIENYIQCKLNLARQTDSNGFVIYPKGSLHESAIHDSFKGLDISSYSTDCYSIASRKLDETIFNEDCTSIAFCYGEDVFLQNARAALVASEKILHRPLSAAVLSTLKPVEGRMEVLRTPNGIFIIDFAHTADAYMRLMTFIAKRCPDHSITAVFSSGGNRDRNKRSKMGRIAAQFCKTMILTSEDPRDEGFEHITADLLSDTAAFSPVIYRIPDRQLAISKAVSLSTPYTVTLLLGKGHEHTIEYEKGSAISWNEKEVLLKALKEARL